MAALATIADVESIWQKTVPAEQIANVNRQIGFASAIVRRAILDIDARIAAGTLDADLVSFVVASMVVRYLMNPAGKIQESIEDYSYTRDRSMATGALSLSDAELALLRKGRRGAFSVRLGREPATYADLQAAAAYQLSWRE